ADRGLHVPTTLTPEPTKHEGLQPRASERPRVGCCEELGRANSTGKCTALFAKKGRSATLTKASAKKGSSCAITRSPQKNGIPSPRCGDKRLSSLTRRSPGSCSATQAPSAVSCDGTALHTTAITAGHAHRSKPTAAGPARDGTAGSPTSSGNSLSNWFEPTSTPSSSAAGSDAIRCSASAMKPSTSASGRDRKSTRLNSSHLGISY